MTVLDVIEGRAAWSVEAADCLEWLRGLPEQCASLAVTSPPYSDARTYGIGFSRTGEDWVAWAVEWCRELARVARLVVVVVDDKTEDFRYGMTPFLLAADLHRAGLYFRHPVAYFRYGIPGSGGDDWLRNDWEPVLCFSSVPGKLPWADNTACGHPPKWAPGGEMSNRLTDGSRVNKWGGSGRATFPNADGERVRQTGEASQPPPPVHVPENELLPGISPEDLPERILGPGERDKWGRTAESGRERTRSGKRKVTAGATGATRGHKDGDTANGAQYDPPVLANPGNVLKAQYDADEVRQLLEAFVTRKIDQGDVIRCLAGGGLIGSRLAHENEAPFPERLVEVFVKSFAPPGSLVLDCFAGSSTTGHAALRWGRRYIGCDVRPSQVELSHRRLSSIPVDLFSGK